MKKMTFNIEKIKEIVIDDQYPEDIFITGPNPEKVIEKLFIDTLKNRVG